MKIVMTLLVRNEDDILEENLLFHKKMGVDFFIVMDHLSTDHTPDILLRYQGLGWLKVINQMEHTYNQGVWVSQMAQEAFTLHGADWVINNDADEFWMPKSGTLRDFFESVPANVGKLHINRLDFYYRNFKDAKFYEALLFREWECRWTKCCHIGASDIRIDIGNHNAYSHEISSKRPFERRMSDEIRIMHFPIRSYSKYRQKIIEGTLFMLNTPGLPSDTGFHWKLALQQINNGSFETEFIKDKLYTQEKLMSGIQNGSIIMDDGLQKFFLGYQE